MTTLDGLSEQDVAERTRAADEAAWLRDRRLRAFKRFVDQDWPDSNEDEFWRQTPFARKFDTSVELVTDGARPATERESLQLEGLAGAVDGPVAVARIVDGTVADVQVPDELEAAGVVVTDLVTAAETHEELVREHLGSLTTTAEEGTGTEEDRTITASDAAWNVGVFVHVPADVEIDTLIVVQVHVTRPGGHLPRVLIVGGARSRATVALEHTSEELEQPAVVDEVVEAIALDGSRLDVVTLNEWETGVAHLSLQKAAVHRDATYRHLSVTVGGSTVRLRPEVDLIGPGASCEPLGIYYADADQHFDLQPYIRHIAPHATSDVLYKGALQGTSRTVFRGTVFVGEDAEGTDTDENNRSLILTEGARADSTPFLEILCSDVTASHGSATGQVDARQLFYAQARGISREEALRLIVFGFFREVVERLGVEVVEKRALAHMEREIRAADLSSIGVGSAVTIGEGTA